MKKLKITALLAVALSFGAAFVPAANAEADVVSVSVDNQLIEFDQNPIIVGEGYTMVPIRAVFEKAGAEVTWDQDSQTATIALNGNTVQITYNKDVMYKNGQEVKLDYPAMVENNRTLIPVRAIAEAMDFSVTWDGHHSLVLISTNGTPYRAYAFLKTGFRTLEDGSEFFSAGSGTTQIDLDNDGKTENIVFTPSSDMSEPSQVLTINDVDYTANLGSLMSAYSISVIDIDENDQTKEIVITENGDTLLAHFYRYDNGILKVINNASGKPATVSYASKLLFSGKASNSEQTAGTEASYIISDLNGTCFVDIMVTGCVYRYCYPTAGDTNPDNKQLIQTPFKSYSSIFGRHLYNTYDDSMLYYVIYTEDYKPGTYKNYYNAGVLNSNDIDSFLVINGYVDPDDIGYMELYVEFTNGTKAVLKPYHI